MDNRVTTQTPDLPEPSDGTNHLIGYDQAAAELGVPKGTLYFWVATKQIPHLRLGPRTVRFRRSELARWVEQRAVKPLGEKAEPKGGK